jgi:catechol 2,3-dioxygenase-like lactoylglutathione lyase family enzyme
MANWDKEIGAMTLFVPDLQAAKAFYLKAFALDGDDVGDDTVMLRFDNTMVFLHEVPGVGGPVSAARENGLKGEGQFAVIVDDVDAVGAELAERGVELLAGPADRPWGMRTLTFADPAGHIWEIAQEIADDAES